MVSDLRLDGGDLEQLRQDTDGRTKVCILFFYFSKDKCFMNKVMVECYSAIKSYVKQVKAECKILCTVISITGKCTLYMCRQGLEEHKGK